MDAVIKKDDQEVGGDPFYTDKQLKAQAAAEANAWTQSHSKAGAKVDTLYITSKYIPLFFWSFLKEKR